MNKKNVSKEGVSKGWFIAGIITILCAVSVPFIVIEFSKTNYNVGDIGNLGSVGDFFGGSTIGLLSIASIFFIIHTISIQSKELSLQRMELELTRKELADTRKVHEESNKTLLLQRFETTFFNLLSQQNELVNNLELSIGGQQSKKGREATSHIYSRLVYFYRYPSFEMKSELNETIDFHERFNLVYYDFIKGFGDYIGPYFRNVKIIIYLIDNSEFTILEKKHYFNIMRAQMSKSELSLLFYNTAFIKEDKDFKDKLIKHNFFEEYINKEDLISPGHQDFLEK